MNFKKYFFVSAGSMALALGVIGIFVPLLPTTPLVLLSLYCYSKGSEKLRQRVLNNRYLGSYIRDYVEKRGIRLSVKIYSLSLLWLSIGYCILYVVNPLWLKLLLLVIAIAVSIHILMIKTLKRNVSKDKDALNPKQAEETAKLTVSLIQFMEQGKFGELGLGISKDSVVECLGSDFTFGDFGDSFIIKYGWYEFFFWTDTKTLYAIQNDSFSASNGIAFENSRFLVDADFLKAGLTLQEVKSTLNSRGIPFSQAPYMEHCENLIFESGVYLDFFNETQSGKTVDSKDDYELAAIRLYE